MSLSDLILGIIVILVIGSVILGVGLALRMFLRYRGRRVITCPETENPAAVHVNAAAAARHAMFGKQNIRLDQCSRWPERQNCGQECLSEIKADPERAREMFSYAASYFGNADAQYDLARLYLRSAGSSRDDFRYGARWLGLAAQKGQHQAQAMLGQMLFNGDQLPRQAARGLMWLTLARDSATPDETWIKESYNKAIAKASEDDRAMALQMLEHWVQGRKD